MTPRLREAVGQFALPASQPLGYRNRAVILADARGHRPEKPKGPHVSRPAALRAFTLEDPHVKRVPIGQAHHEERALPQVPVQIDQGVPEVHPRFAPGRWLSGTNTSPFTAVWPPS